MDGVTQMKSAQIPRKRKQNQIKSNRMKYNNAEIEECGMHQEEEKREFIRIIISNCRRDSVKC